MRSGASRSLDSSTTRLSPAAGRRWVGDRQPAAWRRPGRAHPSRDVSHIRRRPPLTAGEVRRIPAVPRVRAEPLPQRRHVLGGPVAQDYTRAGERDGSPGASWMTSSTGRCPRRSDGDRRRARGADGDGPDRHVLLRDAESRPQRRICSGGTPKKHAPAPRPPRSANISSAAKPVSCASRAPASGPRPCRSNPVGCRVPVEVAAYGTARR